MVVHIIKEHRLTDLLVIFNTDKNWCHFICTKFLCITNFMSYPILGWVQYSNVENRTCGDLWSQLIQVRYYRLVDKLAECQFCGTRY